MANQRISQFTYTSTITGDELIGVASVSQLEVLLLYSINILESPSKIYQNKSMLCKQHAFSII